MKACSQAQTLEDNTERTEKTHVGYEDKRIQTQLFLILDELLKERKSEDLYTKCGEKGKKKNCIRS